MNTNKYKYIKYKNKYLNLKNEKINQYGAGFVDDISSFESYILYGHGGVPENKEKSIFTLPQGKNVIYFDEFNYPMASRKASAIWEIANALDDTNNVKIFLKLISGCIDNDVRNYKYNNIYPFEITKFKKAGEIINDVTLFFTPLSNTTYNTKIENDVEISKSGIYSVPIGLNYPFKNYCNNLDAGGVMNFGSYINRFKNENNIYLNKISDIDVTNTFIDNAGETYKCGLIGKYPPMELNINNDCSNSVKKCDNAHNKLYDQSIKKDKTILYTPPYLLDNPLNTIATELQKCIAQKMPYNPKPFLLSTILSTLDNFNGTYFVLICRGSLINIDNKYKTITKKLDEIAKQNESIKNNLITIIIEKLMTLINNVQSQLKKMYHENDSKYIIKFDSNDIIQNINNLNRETQNMFTGLLHTIQQITNDTEDEIRKDMLNKRNLDEKYKKNLKLSNESITADCTDLTETIEIGSNIMAKLITVIHTLYETINIDNKQKLLKDFIIIINGKYIKIDETYTFDNFNKIDENLDNSKNTRKKKLINAIKNNINTRNTLENKFNAIAILISNFIKLIKQYHISS